jgi:hypothetical protein
VGCWSTARRRRFGPAGRIGDGLDVLAEVAGAAHRCVDQRDLQGQQRLVQGLHAVRELTGETLGCKMDLGLARKQLLPAAIEIAASLSHQLTRWCTS